MANIYGKLIMCILMWNRPRFWERGLFLRDLKITILISQFSVSFFLLKEGSTYVLLPLSLFRGGGGGGRG